MNNTTSCPPPGEDTQGEKAVKTFFYSLVIFVSLAGKHAHHLPCVQEAQNAHHNELSDRQHGHRRPPHHRHSHARDGVPDLRRNPLAIRLAAVQAFRLPPGHLRVVFGLHDGVHRHRSFRRHSLPVQEIHQPKTQQFHDRRRLVPLRSPPVPHALRHEAPPHPRRRDVLRRRLDAAVQQPVVAEDLYRRPFRLHVPLAADRDRGPLHRHQLVPLVPQDTGKPVGQAAKRPLEGESDQNARHNCRRLFDLLAADICDAVRGVFRDAEVRRVAIFGVYRLFSESRKQRNQPMYLRHLQRQLPTRLRRASSHVVRAQSLPRSTEFAAERGDGGDDGKERARRGREDGLNIFGRPKDTQPREYRKNISEFK